MINTWSITEAWAADCIKRYLSPRPKDSHKNQFGHILAIGGDVGMPGSILMAGQAALRVGAGMATLITNSVHTTNNLKMILEQPELMLYGFGGEFYTDKHAISLIKDLLGKATVVILGPGLGRSQWSKSLFGFILDYLLAESAKLKLKALLMDADGLNLLSEPAVCENYVPRLIKLQSKLILTPHPGEAIRLLHSNKIISDSLQRLNAVKKIANDYGAIVILKGARTLICNEYSDNPEIAICNDGNPGMSSAGMGDVLAGMVAGLIGQGVEAYHACCLAVYLHAKAGDRQAQQYGERGLVATDLFYEIRKLINIEI